jgi:hypothetical protein
LGWFENGAHRASNLYTGARALILAGLLVGASSVVAGPVAATSARADLKPSVGAEATPAAAAPVKVVIIVGPTGSGTAGNIANARKLAAQARGYGASVTEIYSPNATWARVDAAAQGANILIDMGHGNGWPSPYKPYQENTKDGFGLNAKLNGGNLDLKYYGANYIRKYIHLAPNSVVILHGMCYTAGNSEPGNPVPTVEGGRERIENFAAGFLTVGAKVVFAEPGGDVGYILAALFAGKTTARTIFMSESVTSTPLIAYPSHRTVGAHLIAQRDPTGHFRRSVAGNLDATITK